MIPPTPSATVPPDSSAKLLLRLGQPFIEFPRFSIIDLRRQKDFAGNAVPFSEWLTKRLQIGQPFVIQDFDQLEAWDSQFFEIEKLIELSTKKNIPIRNCSSGRDLSFTLRKFADSARQSYQEFQNLYARDLQCPQEWQEQCRKILPTEVQWGGRLDLFQWLPQCARSEVMMAYVGSEGSSSGFHRCFSSTVALNLLMESEDKRPVVCIGTDFESQKKYDTFMSARGISPHVDWVNLGTDELMGADFPLYVYDQKVGDLVIFPPATAHQVWNPSMLSTKVVWNILHPLSLEVGFQYVQPPFNRLCHPDVARTNLSLACAMLSLIREDTPSMLPPDLPLLSRLFRQMVHDESIEDKPATFITLVALPETMIATCNFCSTAIWNRHVRCSECVDFDLCLACYLSGRSCEHSQRYTWAEILPAETCNKILMRAREILGFQPEEPHTPDRKKTLGTAVNDLMKARQNPVTRLCHLCRIDHPEWKGRRCDKCTAFFCFRGLYRHFDMNSADVIRFSALWTCPKCNEICNCRCCHFSTAYVKAEKPASKRRIKPSDPRGKIMGFTDNVFDQKRGQRISNGGANGKSSSDLPGIAQITSQKRQLSLSDLAAHGPPLRKLDFPTPEPDTISRSDYALENQYACSSHHRIGGLPVQIPNHIGPTLPGIANLPQQQSIATHAGVTSAGEGMKNLASAAAAQSRISAFSDITMSSPTALPPLTSFDNHEQYILLPHKDNRNSEIGSALSASSSADTAAVDAVILQSETRIAKLRRYGDELLQLGLEDSHKMLQEELSALEADLRAMKKRKSAVLIENLRMEFPGLADVARKEVEKLGYA